MSTVLFLNGDFGGYHGWLYDVGTARSWACEVWVYRTADLRETSEKAYQPFENDAKVDMAGFQALKDREEQGSWLTTIV